MSGYAMQIWKDSECIASLETGSRSLLYEGVEHWRAAIEDGTVFLRIYLKGRELSASERREFLGGHFLLLDAIKQQSEFCAELMRRLAFDVETAKDSYGILEGKSVIADKIVALRRELNSLKKMVGSYYNSP